jgi:hypothetical protein
MRQNSTFGGWLMPVAPSMDPVGTVVTDTSALTLSCLLASGNRTRVGQRPTAPSG